jgi:hypothetical protein
LGLAVREGPVGLAVSGEADRAWIASLTGAALARPPSVPASAASIRFVPGGERDPLTTGGQVPRNRVADVPGPDDRGSHRLSSLRRGTR